MSHKAIERPRTGDNSANDNIAVKHKKPVKRILGLYRGI
jgi:hypothetical protein